MPPPDSAVEPTELRRLLDDERVEAERVGGQCRGHAAAAGTDDEHVDGVVERIGCHGFSTAVLIAKPAISSGAAR